MKTSSKVVTTVVGALAAAAVALPAQADEAGRFPADWFVLPEDASSYAQASYNVAVEEKDGTTYRRGEDAVNESLDKIFYYTAQSMQRSGGHIGSREKPADAPDDWVPWHLKELYMDMGVNAAGTAGLVTAIGEASVELRWGQTKKALKEQGLLAPAKVEAPMAPESAPEEPAEKADLALNEYTTYEQLEFQVDQVADAVMATGRVKDRPKMREGLLRVAKDLQEVMIDINAYNDSYWDISKFGLDIEISASGKVSTGFTVGGNLRLRFEWSRSNYGAPLAEPMDGNGDKRENLRKLLAGVAKDMDTVGEELYSHSGFDLKTMRLGIGLYASANFGVVKGKLGVTGYAFFTKSSYRANANYGDGRPRIIEDFDIPLVDDEPVAQHMTYATSQGIKYDRVPGGDNAGDRVIYFMNREKFRKGLARATSMGAFFAERAKKKTGDGADYGRWEINQIKPNFALSLEGAAKIATIGGKISLELTFKRG